MKKQYNFRLSVHIFWYPCSTFTQNRLRNFDVQNNSCEHLLCTQMKYQQLESLSLNSCSFWVGLGGRGRGGKGSYCSYMNNVGKLVTYLSNCFPACAGLSLETLSINTYQDQVQLWQHGSTCQGSMELSSHLKQSFGRQLWLLILAEMK